MATFVKTDSENEDFIHLVQFLDADLKIRDGNEHAFYAQFNKVDSIKHVIIAYENDKAVGCGALKQYNNDKMEVKRMYVDPNFRGRGIAVQILSQLENWAVEMGFHSCILETGNKQPEAISLYLECGYLKIENYGQYAGVQNSVCFEKQLDSKVKL